MRQAVEGNIEILKSIFMVAIVSRFRTWEIALCTVYFAYIVRNMQIIGVHC